MAKKKRRYKKKKKTASNLDIAVVTLIVLSILLAVLIYTKSGVIGIKLSEVLRRLDGDYAVCTSDWNFYYCYQISI